MIRFSAVALFLVSLMMVTEKANAQSSFTDEASSGFIFITEIGYLQGTGNVTIDQVERANEGVGARMRFIFGQRINEHLSGGLGIGLDGFSDPSYTILPLFIDVRGYLKNARSTPFAYLDLGHAIGTSDKIQGGWLTNVGLGYKMYFGLFGNKVHFLPSVGFNLQRIQRERQIFDDSQFPPQLETIHDNLTIKSYSINFGVEF